jgi:CheY-like chemotaxis protein
VEDDEEVRNTVVETLSDLGYRVLTARDAQAGLTVVESGIPIDVIFTDVVMPGPLKSREMARRAQERLPNLAVLFTSGYTENSIVHGGKLDAGVELLSKPYTREALARRIRHVIANRKQVSLARARPAAAPGYPKPSEPVRTVENENRSIRVLLVEDDELIRMNSTEMLAESGFAVVEAGNAAQALKVIEADRIDVLVTDLGLPDMKGGELAVEALRRKPGLAIVFATGDSHLPEGAPESAVLLTKPYDEQQIVSAVEQAHTAKSAVAE